MRFAFNRIRRDISTGKPVARTGAHLGERPENHIPALSKDIGAIYVARGALAVSGKYWFMAFTFNSNRSAYRGCRKRNSAPGLRLRAGERTFRDEPSPF